MRIVDVRETAVPIKSEIRNAYIDFIIESLRILTTLEEYGWSPARCIPHGGHQISLNIASGLGLGGNESYPGIFQPFGGFGDGIPVEESYVKLPGIPDIGFEAKGELFRIMKTLSDN